uniref:Uncharacterized protein n=1 Tax=Phaseolus vulgaris TaxID=3885 RepID=V7BHP7_PHAVU|nr:hypothetical protein PHAVU_007G205900g [Phaseolus vulgaris]ESW17045.1 hypothetical protein PHAVU_007G205900g [Phaseolus vulgaris]
MAGDGSATCIDILLAIILPPLGVFLKYGCKVFIIFTDFFLCRKIFQEILVITFCFVLMNCRV